MPLRWGSWILHFLLLPASASRALLLKLIHKCQGKSPLNSLETLCHSSTVSLVKPQLSCGHKLIPAAAEVAMMSYMCITEYYNNTTLKIICWENRKRLLMLQESASRGETVSFLKHQLKRGIGWDYVHWHLRYARQQFGAGYTKSFPSSTTAGK